MSQTVSELLNQVLALPEAERGDVAARIVESLDPTVNTDVEAAWAEEIRRRIDEVRSGKVATMSWEEARSFILSDDDRVD